MARLEIQYSYKRTIWFYIFRIMAKVKLQTLFGKLFGAKHMFIVRINGKPHKSGSFNSYLKTREG